MTNSPEEGAEIQLGRMLETIDSLTRLASAQDRISSAGVELTFNMARDIVPYASVNVSVGLSWVPQSPNPAEIDGPAGRYGYAGWSDGRSGADDDIGSWVIVRGVREDGDMVALHDITAQDCMQELAVNVETETASWLRLVGEEKEVSGENKPGFVARLIDTAPEEVTFSRTEGIRKATEAGSYHIEVIKDEEGNRIRTMMPRERISNKLLTYTFSWYTALGK